MKRARGPATVRDVASEASNRAAAELRFAAVFAHLARVRAYAARRGSADPDDIAAETMAIAWRRLASIPVDDPRPWLFATARNLLQRGSFWYSQTRNTSVETITFGVGRRQYSVPIVHSRLAEVWMADSGSGATSGAPISSTALIPGQRRLVEKYRDRLPRSIPPKGTLLTCENALAAQLGNRALIPSTLAELPDKEASLRRVLNATQGGASRSTSEPRVAADEFREVSNAFFIEPLNAKIRATLFRLLATIPGVDSLGTATDALGRRGAKVGIDAGGIRSTLLFDKARGRVLEFAEVKLSSPTRENPTATGTVILRNTMIATSVVAAIGERPDGQRLNTAHWNRCESPRQCFYRP